MMLSQGKLLEHYRLCVDALLCPPASLRRQGADLSFLKRHPHLELHIFEMQRDILIYCPGSKSHFRLISKL